MQRNDKINNAAITTISKRTHLADGSSFIESLDISTDCYEIENVCTSDEPAKKKRNQQVFVFLYSKLIKFLIDALTI